MNNIETLLYDIINNTNDRDVAREEEKKEEEEVRKEKTRERKKNELGNTTRDANTYERKRSLSSAETAAKRLNRTAD